MAGNFRKVLLDDVTRRLRRRLGKVHKFQCEVSIESLKRKNTNKSCTRSASVRFIQHGFGAYCCDSLQISSDTTRFDIGIAVLSCEACHHEDCKRTHTETTEANQRGEASEHQPQDPSMSSARRWSSWLWSYFTLTKPPPIMDEIEIRSPSEELKCDGRRWVHDRRDVEGWIANCPQCRFDKRRDFQNPWRGLPNTSKNEALYSDFLGPIS